MSDNTTDHEKAALSFADELIPLVSELRGLALEFSESIATARKTYSAYNHERPPYIIEHQLDRRDVGSEVRIMEHAASRIDDLEAKLAAVTRERDEAKQAALELVPRLAAQLEVIRAQKITLDTVKRERDAALRAVEAVRAWRQRVQAEADQKGSGQWVARAILSEIDAALNAEPIQTFLKREK